MNMATQIGNTSDTQLIKNMRSVDVKIGLGTTDVHKEILMRVDEIKKYNSIVGKSPVVNRNNRRRIEYVLREINYLRIKYLSE